MVIIAAIRDDGIDAVVATGHLEDNEDGGVFAGGDLGGADCGFGIEGRNGAGEKAGDGPGNGAAEDGGAEELATGLDGDFVFHRSAELKIGRAHDEANGTADVVIIRISMGIKVIAQGAFLLIT